MLKGIAPAQMRRIPPSMQQALLRRGEWSLCAMEHSRIGPVSIDDPGAPFHHLSLPLERVRLNVRLHSEGHRQRYAIGPDSIGMIEAGVGGTTSWDDVYESACFYFSNESLSVALGCDVGANAHAIRTDAGLHAPVLTRLLHALHADAGSGQPHGQLVGDAIFIALAAQLVPGKLIGSGFRAGDWRVRRALEYIHANLSQALNIQVIADAAATSPFHLSRAFRGLLGCSIWRYVLRERARHAQALMKVPGQSLAEVSQLAGFETYASFIAAMRHEFGQPPAKLRQVLTDAR
jgi:AraC family transcriptional regulator